MNEVSDFGSVGLRWGARFAAVLATCTSSLLWSCSSDNSTEPPPPSGPDTTSPAAITDLRSSTLLATTIALVWTAPGDDGESGTAVEYDLRFSTLPLDDSNWRNAPAVSGLDSPLSGGLTERVTVTGLSPLTTYYFVVSTRDDAGNWSERSNFHDATTIDVLDVVPPSRVEDLAVSAVSDSSVTLRWTAPGDDGDVGTAFAYDIRYLDAPITVDNWISAEIPDVSPIPRPAGTVEIWEVVGLSPQTTYHFAMVVLDERRNASPLSNGVETATN